MKRTDRLTKLIAILLFLAFLAYAAVYASRALGEQTVTAEAFVTSVSVGGNASGIAVRRESVLRSSEPYIDISAADGAKVAAGETLALAMNSSTGLERAGRMHQLELEIERVSLALSSMSSADDLTARDSSLQEAVLELTGSVARGDFSAIDSACLSLESLLFPDSTQATRQQLEDMQRELYSLRNSSSSDTHEIQAREAGVFFSSTDGYEALSPDDLEGLTPAKLEALVAARSEPYSDAFGKLITDYRWYFAAAMDEEAADKLSAGGSVTLDFGRYYGGGVSARVESISPVDNGRVAVVFRCSSALADTLSMRQAAASVVFEEYSGIRVPSQAVQTDDETLQTYVWVISAMQLERKNINIIYCGDGYVLAEREAAANSLREGNTVVVSGSDLYEGKLME